MRIDNTKTLRIMMTNPTLYMVDVFAIAKYTGNQLAVVRNASKLTTDQMQRIANEMHFSETTFIPSDQKQKGGYDVSIFTPANELPFAGHPTLGTAYIIKHFIADENINKVTLNLKVGSIPVTFEEDAENQETLWMHQIPPTFGNTYEPMDIAKTLGLNEKDIDVNHPIQAVSTGVPFLIVPLKTLKAVKQAKVNRQSKQNTGAPTEILVFSPETYNKQNNLNVRVFVDLFGIPEDPATGSGNGCLAAYLAHHKYFGDAPVNVKVEQGYEIGRPSLLLLRAENRNDKITVHVGGKVFLIAKGELLNTDG